MGLRLHQILENGSRVKMAISKYSRFHLTIQKLASNKASGWFLSRSLRHLDRIFLKLSAGRFTLTGLLTGVPVGLLTTTGARSGLPRTHPLLYLVDESDPDKIALVASNFGQKRNPAWYYNLKANPEATFKIDGQVGAYTSCEAVGEEYERLWKKAEETFLGYQLYKQRAGNRRIPIMVLTRIGRLYNG
jgi:deazaflavin-dependent oxidoreductase (nitroreductase family)